MRMPPRVLQLDGMVGLDHTVHRFIYVVVVALVDPGVPELVALFRGRDVFDAEDSEHGVIGQHLTVASVGRNSNDPQADVKGIHDIVILGTKHGLIADFVAIPADPVDQEIGEDPDLSVIVNGISGIIHTDKANGFIPVAQRNCDESLNILKMENFPLVGAGILDGIQVVDDDRLLQIKMSYPPFQDLFRNTLEMLHLRGDMFHTPFKGVVPAACFRRTGLKEVGTVCLIEFAYRSQYLLDRLIKIRKFCKRFGIAYDSLRKFQLLSGALTHHFPLGDVRGDLQSQAFSLIWDDLILQQEMAATVFVFVFPDIEGILIELIIGAEWAGSVQTLEGLVAFSAPVVLDTEETLSRWV